MTEPKRCETCFFWTRIAHSLDFEIGRCQLFEREQHAPDHCAMWEGPMSGATSGEIKNQAGDEKPLG